MNPESRRNHEEHAEGSQSPEHPSDEDAGREKEPERNDVPRRPSVGRITASALASATATGLLSYLGVAGTIIGAAISSVLVVVGNYVWGVSITRTVDKVRAGAPTLRAVRSEAKAKSTSRSPRGDSDVHGTDAEARTTGARPDDDAVDEADAVAEADDDESTPAGENRWRAAWRATVERHGWGKILGAAVVVFLILMAVVTVVELAAGKPLTDVVRSEEGTGTSLFGQEGSAEQTPSDEEPVPGEDPPDEEPAPDEEAPGEEAPGEEAPGDEAPPAPEPTL